MSRNSKRTSKSTSKSPPVSKLAPQDNNIFSFVTPTEFVEIPSRGQFYGTDHPLHNVEVVEIRHMTAKEEDILTSETLLQNGLVMERLLQSVIVDKNIDPNTLLIGDKNALLIAIRQTGFGDIYTTEVSCPACTKGVEKDFSIEAKEIKGSNTPENAHILENGNFLLDIPEYNLALEIRLLTGLDEVNIARHMESRKKLKMETGNITQLLKTIIVGVNDMREPSVIHQVVEAMPVALSRQVRAAYEAAMPNIELYGEFECSYCNHAERLEVPITLNFFWPKF